MNYKMVYIIGAGLFGSVIAERVSSLLKLPIIIVDKREHIGGNCFAFNEPSTGINCHKYGAHIFHTSDKKVYNYLSSFVEFNCYRHQVMTRSNGRIYQMPINLKTINQFFDVCLTPQQCKEFLEKKIAQSHIDSPANLEEQAISLIGEELYNAFIRGYTAKQWQRDPKDLPSYIINRLPFRTNFNSDYFSDSYQGIPIGGYQNLFDKLLCNPLIKVFLNTSYNDIKKEIKSDDLIIYTGAPDELFDFRYGKLEWRSLDFKWEIHNVSDFQGIAVLNEADDDVLYTRTHEFKHFHPENKETYELGRTVICREYSKEYKEGDTPYYPIDTNRNRKIYAKYKILADRTRNLYLGGRLGMYKYMDMDKTVRAAFELFNQIVEYKKY